MQLRPIRLALHAVAAIVLASSGVLLVGAPSRADSAARPDSYGGDATASALHFVADRTPPLSPVSDAFHAELPYATTSLDSSGSITAAAASLYPGGGLLGVPALLCQFATQLCTAPIPRYSLMATASYPTTPDDRADAAPGTILQGPLTVDANLTLAHADQNRVEATTKAGGTGVNGVVSADSTATHSKQAFEGSTLVVTAESAVTGLDIGAGQLHIDSVRSVASARVDGATVTAASATTTITGATAGGQAVVIDSTGIHVPGSGDNGAAQSAANTALKALDASGITVRLLTPSKLAKTGTAAAATGGLFVTFTQSVDLPLPKPPPLPPSLPGVPGPNGDYTGSVTLAGAGVTAFATPALDLTFPLADTFVGGQTPPLPGTVSQPGSVAVPPMSVGATEPAPAVAGPATAPALAGAAHQSGSDALLGFDLKDKRVRLLTLILLGYPLVVLLTAPLRAPARLPRAG